MAGLQVKWHTFDLPEVKCQGQKTGTGWLVQFLTLFNSMGLDVLVTYSLFEHKS